MGPGKTHSKRLAELLIAGIKILVSDESDKMSGVFGLRSDIFEIMSIGLGFSSW